MPAAADNDRVVGGFRLRVAPGRRPVFLAGQTALADIPAIVRSFTHGGFITLLFEITLIGIGRAKPAPVNSAAPYPCGVALTVLIRTNTAVFWQKLRNFV